MKVFILFLLSSLCYTIAAKNIFQNGAATCARVFPKCELKRNLNLDVSKINVYFYDFKNPVRIFPVDKAVQGILSIKNINTAKKFFMYVGGFRSNIKEPSTNLLINTFRKIDNSYLIIVDHSEYTKQGNGSLMKSYERSVKYVPDIGKKLGEMLAGLERHRVSSKKMHCIGHSLGGQILGHVGEKFSKLTKRKILRITALDPAGPCFEKKQEHIRSGVADYVEVYHCDNVFGSQKSFGDVDFFANNGKSQPECKTPFWWSPCKVVEASRCSHNSCVNMWMASVKNQNQYPAYQRFKQRHLKHGQCSLKKNITAGFWNPGNATGEYCFHTVVGKKYKNKKFCQC